MLRPKVIITSSKKTGGVKTFAQGLSSALGMLRYECIIVDSTRDLLNPKAINELRQPGVVLISSLSFGVFNLIARTSIFVLHGFPRLDDVGFLRFTKIALASKLFARWATRVSAISQMTYLANAAFFGISAHSIIGNPYIPSSTPPNGKSTDGTIRAIYVGRLVTVKRVEQVIRGFLVAAEQLPNLHLEIVGTGPKEAFLKRLAEHPRISFSGAVPNSVALSKMHQSHIFISLAEGENFGITFIEALSAGCYLICPTSGGHLDWAVDYPQVEYVKNIFDSEEVARAILQAAKKLGDTQRPLDSNWNLKIAEKYDALIREALNETSGRTF